MFQHLRAFALSLGALTALSGAVMAERLEIWDSGKAADHAWASDCQDCEEDRGVLLECNRDNRYVTFSVPGLARENARENGSVSVRLRVDGNKRRTFHGAYELQGLIGYFPVFKLKLQDRLIEQIAAGQKLVVTSKGDTMNIRLKSSRGAITTLRRACG